MDKASLKTNGVHAIQQYAMRKTKSSLHTTPTKIAKA